MPSIRRRGSSCALLHSRKPCGRGYCYRNSESKYARACVCAHTHAHTHAVSSSCLQNSCLNMHITQHSIHSWCCYTPDVHRPTGKIRRDLSAECECYYCQKSVHGLPDLIVASLCATPAPPFPVIIALRCSVRVTPVLALLSACVGTCRPGSSG